MFPSAGGDAANPTALAEAQQRLAALRRADKEARAAAGLDVAPRRPAPAVPPVWDAAEVARQAQSAAWRRVGYVPAVATESPKARKPKAQKRPHNYKPSTLTVRIFPSMLLDLDELGFYAEARLHAVLRAIDAAGRGVLPIADLRTRLCESKSPEYLYGWRRLRQVLGKGEGIFWERQDWGKRGHHIHLKGRGRILAHFGLTIRGHELLIPLGQLLGRWTNGRGREAASKAAIYAAALTDRTKPMSRKARENAYGLSRWRQWRYEDRRQVRRKTAIIIGASYSDQLLERIRRKQPGAFCFTDYRGKLGPAHGRYIAYAGGVLTQAPKDAGDIVESSRNRKRLNAQAKNHAEASDHLWTNGAGGKERIMQVWYDADSKAKAERQATKEAGRPEAIPVLLPIAGVSGGRRAVLYDDLAEAEASHARASMRAVAELARGRAAGPSMFTAWGSA